MRVVSARIPFIHIHAQPRARNRTVTFTNQGRIPVLKNTHLNAARAEYKRQATHPQTSFSRSSMTSAEKCHRCKKKERKQTTQGRDGRTARRHHTGILRRGVWCASRRPPLGVRLFLSHFAVSLRFSLQPSCHLAVSPFSSCSPLSHLPLSSMSSSFRL